MRTVAAVVGMMLQLLQLHWLMFGPVVGWNLPDGPEHGGHAADELLVTVEENEIEKTQMEGWKQSCKVLQDQFALDQDTTMHVDSMWSVVLSLSK